MTYKEALDYLYSRLPMFQRIGAPALKYDLSNTINILEVCGNPHLKLKCVHIAGTNGKGSSAHAIASILQEAGYKVGLFTSPHLKSFTERARINGVEMPEDFVISFIQKYKTGIENISPSFFEVTFAMAVTYFAKSNVDWAVIETGLGGRLDSTNVIKPQVCLITMIGWDHADLLGNTLEQIAQEKAGIIKPETPVVIGADQSDLLHVFQEKANSENAPLYTCEKINIRSNETGLSIETAEANSLTLHNIIPDISAAYFLKNIPGVIKVIELLKDLGTEVSSDHVSRGLSRVKINTCLKGRWQLLRTSPDVVCDVSHNPPGLTELFKQARVWNKGQLHLVIGMVKDKDLTKALSLISTLNARLYFTQSDTPRSLPVEELKLSAELHGLSGEAFKNVNDAIKSAKFQAQKEDLILICGSTFVVAEIDDL